MERDDSQDRYVVDAMQAAGDLDAASASSAAEAVLTVRFDSFNARASLIHFDRLR
jgi:hypothetical protein